MAEVKQNKVWVITFWVVFSLILFGAVGYFAWNRADSPGETVSEEISQESSDVADVDKLNANETKLTPENYDDFTKQAGVVLVDVYSPTCSHCQAIAPILSELADEYVGKVKIGKMSVEVDANRDFILSREKDFAYVPAIWIYKDGMVVESFTGERSKDEFKELLDKQL